MDSLTHVVMGAAVGIAVMRRRTATWKAALWGAVACTLPDLDVLIDQGDPILNMVLHRAETHAVFWLTLFSPLMAAAVTTLHGERALWRRWWLALWLALVTHPLLDLLTVYGTRLGLPFTAQPYGLGSVFIIDPLVTLPWLLGAGWAVASRGSAAGLRANGVGLLLGAGYLAWGVAAQQMVTHKAMASLQQQGVHAERVLVTPVAFNSVLWRVVAVTGPQYLEGFHSLLDAPGPMQFDRFDRGAGLDAALRTDPAVQHIRDFSRGFYKLHEQAGRVQVTDLRMGLEPHYTFSFVVAAHASPLQPVSTPMAVGTRVDLGLALRWWWRRSLGEVLPPPR